MDKLNYVFTFVYTSGTMLTGCSRIIFIFGEKSISYESAFSTNTHETEAGSTTQFCALWFPFSGSLAHKMTFYCSLWIDCVFWITNLCLLKTYRKYHRCEAPWIILFHAAWHGVVWQCLAESERVEVKYKIISDLLVHTFLHNHNLLQMKRRPGKKMCARGTA